MIPIDRFERRFQDSLADLADEQVPSYVSDLLARTARQRQRPAWAFPERWLPMTIALRRPIDVPHLRLLTVAAMLILVTIVATSSLTHVSLQPAAVSSLPGNGLIAFLSDETHVHSLDRASGTTSPWLRSDTPMTNLGWSPDGTRLAFIEGPADGGSLATIGVACTAGHEDLCQTPVRGAFGRPRLLRWAPDGSALLVVSGGATDGTGVLTLSPADGAAARRIEVGMSVDWANWAPDSASILIKGTPEDGVPRLYRVPLDGATAPVALGVDTTTPLFARWSGSEYLWDPAYAPDGSTIMYSTVAELLPRQRSDRQNARVRMVDADGANDRLFEISADSDYEVAAGWSPDGTRVAIAVQHLDDPLLAIAPVEDPTKAIVVGPDPAIVQAEHVAWSPDGTTLLSWGTDGATALIDAATGAITPIDVPIHNEAAWQPLLP